LKEFAMTINIQSGNVKTQGGLVRRLWNDDCGALIGTEWMIIATIMVIGLIPGYIALRQGALNGLVDFANGVGSLDQSYSYSGQRLECDCWNRTGKDLNGTEKDRSRQGLNGSGKVNRDLGAGRAVSAHGEHSEWQRNWAIAETAGSQYIKTKRPPLQLKPTNPTSVGDVGRVTGCN
jgi:hypothetical protein